MRIAVAIAVCLLLAPLARAQPMAGDRAAPRIADASAAKLPTAPANVHPAVARIVAPGEGSVSYGSGTLVHVTGDVGLVITNWHVVNEATGPISVHFPDGFYSLGTVRNVDRDWDLAAIAIRRPNIQPVAMANRPPQPGEILTIAGYGSGTYRAASGPCTQYVAPGLEFPYEMVEVAVSARQGDSGGPIFNSRGELAGVLFGEGNGRTSGSYCGRVQWFLTSVVPSAPSTGAIAQRPLESLPTRPASAVVERPASASASAMPVPANGQTGSTIDALARGTSSPAIPASDNGSWQVESRTPATSSDLVASTRAPQAAPEAIQIGWRDIAGETWPEQAKTVLAGIGILALILQGLRWISRDEAKA